MGREQKGVPGSLLIGVAGFARRMRGLITQPVFLVLTAAGNGLIVIGALSLYFLEGGTNPRIHSLLDTLWWAVATVTTVGYGDVSPATNAGKCVGIVLMLLGTTLFCSFTALFAAVILSPELRTMKQDVKEIGASVLEFEREVHLDEAAVDHHLAQIEASLKELRAARKKSA